MSESSMQHYRDQVVAVAVRQAHQHGTRIALPCPYHNWSGRPNGTICADCGASPMIPETACPGWSI